jgi:hypothetical protein
MNTNTIPQNYTEYSVRLYQNVVDENGDKYGMTDILDGTDYTHARDIFINALINGKCYYCVELIVNTADEDDDSREIVVERWDKKAVESDDAKHRREYPDHRTCDECDCCIGCECCECEKDNELCQDCRKRPKYDDGVCEKCYAVRLGCDSEEEEKKPEKPVRIFVGEWGKAPIVSDSDDSDWDGDLDDTPNCHQCGEDCGRSIIAHQKYRKTYFCSEECNREYDGEDE